VNRKCSIFVISIVLVAAIAFLFDRLAFSDAVSDAVGDSDVGSETRITGNDNSGVFSEHPEAGHASDRSVRPGDLGHVSIAVGIDRNLGTLEAAVGFSGIELVVVVVVVIVVMIVLFGDALVKFSGLFGDLFGQRIETCLVQYLDRFALDDMFRRGLNLVLDFSGHRLELFIVVGDDLLGGGVGLFRGLFETAPHVDMNRILVFYMLSACLKYLSLYQLFRVSSLFVSYGL